MYDGSLIQNVDINNVPSKIRNPVIDAKMQMS